MESTIQTQQLRADGMDPLTLTRCLRAGTGGEFWEAITADRPTPEAGSHPRPDALVFVFKGTMHDFRARLGRIAELAGFGWRLPDAVTQARGIGVVAIYTVSHTPDLGRWLAASPAPARPDVIALFADMCNALAAAHAAHMSHDHLGSDCVLVEGGKPLIIDLPLGEVSVGEHAWAQESGGDPAPPPRLAGARDIRAMGVGLWSSLDRWASGARAGDHRNPTLTGSGFEPVEDILGRAAANGTARGYTQISRMATDLERLLTPAPATRPSGRWVGPACVACAALLAGVGVLFAYTGLTGARTLPVETEESPRLVRVQADLAEARSRNTELTALIDRRERAIGSLAETLHYSNYRPEPSKQSLAAWSMVEMLIWPIGEDQPSFERRINFQRERLENARRIVSESYATADSEHIDAMLAELCLAAWEFQLGHAGRAAPALESLLPRLSGRLQPSDPLLKGANQLLSHARSAVNGETVTPEPGDEPWVRTLFTPATPATDPHGGTGYGGTISLARVAMSDPAHETLVADLEYTLRAESWIRRESAATPTGED